MGQTEANDTLAKVNYVRIQQDSVRFKAVLVRISLQVSSKSEKKKIRFLE